MSRILLVLATIAALLACPFRCETVGRGSSDVDVCACCPRSFDHDHAHCNGSHDQDEHDSDDHGCSCLCCSGALPEPNVVCLTLASAGDFVSPEAPVVAVVAQLLGVAHDRWRLHSPPSDAVSGRALRSRMASLVV